MDATSSSRKRFLRWTHPGDRVLITELLRHSRNGRKVNNKFVAETWAQVADKFNKKCIDTGIPTHSNVQVQNRCASLKKSWKDFCHLLKTDGFYWDEKNGKILAEEGLWAKHLKAHPRAKIFKEKPLENFKDLCELFGDARPTTGVGNSLVAELAGRQVYEDEHYSSGEEYSEEEDPSLEKIRVGGFSHQDSPVPGSNRGRARDRYFPTRTIPRPSHPTASCNSLLSRSRSPYSTTSAYSTYSNPSASIRTQRNYGHSTARSRHYRRDHSNATRGRYNARDITEISNLFTTEMDRLIAAIKSLKEEKQQTKVPELPAQYAPYAGAVSKAVKLYLNGDISKSNFHLALSSLKYDPLKCVTFSMMSDDLCVDWVMDKVKETEERGSDTEV